MLALAHGGLIHTHTNSNYPQQLKKTFAVHLQWLPNYQKNPFKHTNMHICVCVCLSTATYVHTYSYTHCCLASRVLFMSSVNNCLSLLICPFLQTFFYIFNSLLSLVLITLASLFLLCPYLSILPLPLFHWLISISLFLEQRCQQVQLWVISPAPLAAIVGVTGGIVKRIKSDLSVLSYSHQKTLVWLCVCTRACIYNMRCLQACAHATITLTCSQAERNSERDRDMLLCRLLLTLH